MRRSGPKDPERAFGFSVGLVLSAVAALFLGRGRAPLAGALGATGGLLIVLAAARPRWLKRPSAVWWRMAHALAYVNARVLLTLIFAIVLTPVGLLWRLAGKDPLARRRQPSTGWSPYPIRYRDRNHYERMF